MTTGANRLIVAPGGWAADLPEWLLDAIRAERMVGGLASVMSGQQPQAGDAEVCAYLFTLNLTQPPDHNTAEIFIWLTGTLMQRHDRFKDGVPDFVQETLSRGLNSDQQRELDQLRHDITTRRGKVSHPLFEILAEFKKEAAKAERTRQIPLNL